MLGGLKVRWGSNGYCVQNKCPKVCLGLKELTNLLPVFVFVSEFCNKFFRGQAKQATVPNLTVLFYAEASITKLIWSTLM